MFRWVSRVRRSFLYLPVAPEHRMQQGTKIYYGSSVVLRSYIFGLLQARHTRCSKILRFGYLSILLPKSFSLQIPSKYPRHSVARKSYTLSLDHGALGKSIENAWHLYNHALVRKSKLPISLSFFGRACRRKYDFSPGGRLHFCTSERHAR